MAGFPNTPDYSGLNSPIGEEYELESLAVEGRMESPLDSDALRRRLAELFSLEAVPSPVEHPWWIPARGWLRK